MAVYDKVCDPTLRSENPICHDAHVMPPLYTFNNVEWLSVYEWPESPRIVASRGAPSNTNGPDHLGLYTFNNVECSPLRIGPNHLGLYTFNNVKCSLLRIARITSDCGRALSHPQTRKCPESPRIVLSRTRKHENGPNHLGLCSPAGRRRRAGRRRVAAARGGRGRATGEKRARNARRETRVEKRFRRNAAVPCGSTF